jgi:hypothetical protein
MLVPEPFEITGTGAWAIGYDAGAVVAFSGDGQAKMFRRRAIRRYPDGTTVPIEMLVAELDGVRTYLRREADGRLSIVVSRLDLQP